MKDNKVVNRITPICDQLEELYKTILNKSDSNTHLIVAGYPRLFSDIDLGTCSIIGKNEAALVNNYILWLNQLISNIVGEVDKEEEYAGRIHFVPVADMFWKHEAYSSAETYLHGIELLKSSEDLNNTILSFKRNDENSKIEIGYDFVSAASMHPNSRGAQAYAERVQSQIDIIEEQKKNAAIAVFVANDKELDYTGSSAMFEDAYGNKTIMELSIYENNAKAFCSDAIKPGMYKITVTKSGCPALSVVREIKEGFNEFVFKMPEGAKSPEETIRALEKAMNDLDQDALMACFDLSLNRMYDGALEIGEALTDIPFGGIADFASGMGPLLSAFGFEYKVKIDNINIVYSEDGESCIASMRITTSAMGQVHSEETQLPMHLIGRDWYFSFQGINDLTQFMHIQ